MKKKGKLRWFAVVAVVGIAVIVGLVWAGVPSVEVVDYEIGVSVAYEHPWVNVTVTLLEDVHVFVDRYEVWHGWRKVLDSEMPRIVEMRMNDSVTISAQTDMDLAGETLVFRVFFRKDDRIKRFADITKDF